jgi:hypothetical protein
VNRDVDLAREQGRVDLTHEARLVVHRGAVAIA